MTNAELRKLFRKYNRKYWKNKLPSADVRFANIDRTDLGICLRFAGEAEIKISNEIKAWPKIAEMTLIHEMAHLALSIRVQHGPKFEKEMKRLAASGAFSKFVVTLATRKNIMAVDNGPGNNTAVLFLGNPPTASVEVHVGNPPSFASSENGTGVNPLEPSRAPYNDPQQAGCSVTGQPVVAINTSIASGLGCSIRIANPA